MVSVHNLNKNSIESNHNERKKKPIPHHHTMSILIAGALINYYVETFLAFNRENDIKKKTIIPLLITYIICNLYK